MDGIVSVNQHKTNIHKTHSITPQFSFYGLALYKQNSRKKGKEREQQLNSFLGKERNKMGFLLYRKVKNLIGMGKKKYETLTSTKWKVWMQKLVVPPYQQLK